LPHRNWQDKAELILRLNAAMYGPTQFRMISRSRGFMTTFDRRKEGFESKFAHDEELRFKATARRNKLLGLWAAEKMGLQGPEAEAYAKTVVNADFAEPGDEDVFRKVRGDFDANKVTQSDHQIRRTMDELMSKAIEQIQNAQK
jgi:hypothetical protein